MEAQAMDGGLYDRDFFTWTRVQADALRRLAETRANLGAGLDLPHLIEEVEDLGNEQVHRVQGNLRRLFQHLICLAAEPTARSARHWRGEALGFRHSAARRFLASMRRVVEPGLHAEWRAARRIAEAKLGRELPHLPAACPFALEALLDEDGVGLDALVAALHPPGET
jgi:hypothetical protein